MTIEALLIGGVISGLLIEFAAPNGRIGCAVLGIVPIAMIVGIWIRQWQHPENLRSTSALDFMFGPLWTSLGAGVGFVAGVPVRSFLDGRGRTDR